MTVADAHRKRRVTALLDVVNRIAQEKNAALVGTRQQVLCEGPSKTNAARLTGKLLDIRIEESGGFSLFGSLCD